uniref:Ribosomal protein S12 n=1 Tax=Hordeum brevisubulatum subsp. violaceum TaxID=37673 RepID=A0A7T8G552_9POAL|nr:ribosomal protein S12 [Hordeum brevisubulatum subsp. violaceum]
MPTVKQLIRNARQPIRNARKTAALKGCPQRRGTCARVYVRLVQIMTSNKYKKIMYGSVKGQMGSKSQKNK